MALPGRLDDREVLPRLPRARAGLICFPSAPSFAALMTGSAVMGVTRRCFSALEVVSSLLLPSSITICPASIPAFNDSLLESISVTDCRCDGHVGCCCVSMVGEVTISSVVEYNAEDRLERDIGGRVWSVGEI